MKRTVFLLSLLFLQLAPACLFAGEAAPDGIALSPKAGTGAWEFGNGAEFPGARGGLVAVKDRPEPGQSSLRLEGDFSQGGLHVEASLDLTPYALTEGSRIEFKACSTHAPQFVVRLVDESGQCFQKKDYFMPTDGKWHDFSLKTADMAGTDHWGGANDGTWHGRPTTIKILLPKDYSPESAQPTVDLEIAQMRALPPASAPAP